MQQKPCHAGAWPWHWCFNRLMRDACRHVATAEAQMGRKSDAEGDFRAERQQK